MPKWTKILKSKKVKARVEKKAQAVQGFIVDATPTFGDRPPHRSAPAHGSPGDAKAAIHITDMSGADGARARVGTNDFKAKWIEYGNAHMPPYAPFAKAKARFQ